MPSKRKAARRPIRKSTASKQRSHARNAVLTDDGERIPAAQCYFRRTDYGDDVEFVVD